MKHTYTKKLEDMRPKAGDPPRTMPQKILAGRAEGDPSTGSVATVRVDQVIFARSAERAFDATEPVSESAVESAVAYEAQAQLDAPMSPLPTSLVDRGIAIARNGVGFPDAVHLERFAAPSRLALTDDPAMAALGGVGMLTLVASEGSLRQALRSGQADVVTPTSVQVLLSGKLRPFVTARDLALELIQRGLSQRIREVDREHGGPVVLEFAGPSARLLSVGERAELCALAPAVGACAGLFVSDEKTEVFLRDQRRSKAFRGLSPDAGAPFAEVDTIDLSTIDPMLQLPSGEIIPIREREGQPLSQAVLGGSPGAGVREMLVAAALLKSKRVSAHLELLVCPASRQVLEVLAQTKALADFAATGARLIEPHPALLRSHLYEPSTGLSLRSYDSWATGGQRFAVASAPSVAFAVAHGCLGDPRGFKRPVRVTVPRTLPAEDVLLVRRQRSKSRARSAQVVPESPLPPKPHDFFEQARTMQVGRQLRIARSPAATQSLAFLAVKKEEEIRVLVSNHIPSGWQEPLCGAGVLGLEASEAQLESLDACSTVVVTPNAEWGDTVTLASSGGPSTELRWRANGPTRELLRSGLRV